MLSIEIEQYLSEAKRKMALNDNKGALLEYQKVIALDPGCAEAYYGRGRLKCTFLPNDFESLKDFNKAIELNPEYAEAYDYRGNIKVSLGDYAGAITDLTRAIELNPKIAEAYFGRALAKEHINDIDGAIEDLRIADELGFDGAYEVMQRIRPTPFPKQTKERFKREMFSELEKSEGKEFYCRILKGKDAIVYLHRAGKISEAEAMSHDGIIKTLYFKTMEAKNAFMAGVVYLDTFEEAVILDDNGAQLF